MRVTFNSMHRDSSAGLERSSSRLLEYQRQVSTGRRIEKPSDDPSSTATSIVERSGIATAERYTRAADSVASRLDVVDTVLSDVIDKLSAAQVAIVSARGTTATPSQREAAAQELLSLRDSLLEDLNAAFRGTYLFGGQSATTRPYEKNPDGSIAPYAAAVGEVAVDIEEGRSVTVVFNGEAIAKGGDADDVFAAFDAAITAARTGDDDGLQSSMEALRRAFDRTTYAQSRVGAAIRTVDTEKVRLTQMKTAAESRVSKLEDANMAEAISGMAQADAAYRAALGAAGALTRISLMDYLK